MKRRLEEILEECLSAHLEGRRSIEESLSLYPSLSADLEPLLRTAADVSDSFQYQTPCPYRQELGRQRLLAAASVRTRARALTSRVNGFERATKPWGSRHWGLLGTAAAAAVGTVILASALIGGGGGSDRTAGGPTATARPEVVLNITEAQENVNRLKAKTSHGQEIDAADIQSLAETTNKLAQVADPEALNEDTRLQLEQVIQQQYELLQQLAANAPEDQRDPVRQVLGVTRDLADKWDIPIVVSHPSATPAAPTPTPTGQPVATPEPTVAPTPPPVETATPTPVTSPEAFSSPTPEPVRRPLSAP